MRYGAFGGAVLAMLVFAACDDPNSGIYDPLIRHDTVSLAVPAVAPEIPSALDVAYSASLVRGRYPELAADAENWDITIRRDGSTLVFAPAGLFDFQNPIGGGTTAALTEPLERTLTEVTQAPSDGAFRGDTMIAIQSGRVYAMRSRATGQSFGGCQNFAKVQALEVDAAAGTVRLHVVGNARCNDRRLVEED